MGCNPAKARVWPAALPLPDPSALPTVPPKWLPASALWLPPPQVDGDRAHPHLDSDRGPKWTALLLPPAAPEVELLVAYSMKKGAGRGLHFRAPRFVLPAERRCRQLNTEERLARAQQQVEVPPLEVARGELTLEVVDPRISFLNTPPFKHIRSNLGDTIWNLRLKQLIEQGSAYFHVQRDQEVTLHRIMWALFKPGISSYCAGTPIDLKVSVWSLVEPPAGASARDRPRSDRDLLLSAHAELAEAEKELQGHDRARKYKQLRVDEAHARCVEVRRLVAKPAAGGDATRPRSRSPPPPPIRVRRPSPSRSPSRIPRDSGRPEEEQKGEAAEVGNNAEGASLGGAEYDAKGAPLGGAGHDAKSLYDNDPWERWLGEVCLPSTGPRDSDETEGDSAEGAALAAMGTTRRGR